MILLQLIIMDNNNRFSGFDKDVLQQAIYSLSEEIEHTITATINEYNEDMLFSTNPNNDKNIRRQRDIKQAKTIALKIALTEMTVALAGKSNEAEIENLMDVVGEQISEDSEEIFFIK